MKKKRLEIVERTYCDMCGKDISHGTKYGYVIPSGESWDICDGYGKDGVRFSWMTGHKYGSLSCQQKTEMKIAIESGDRYLS